MATQVRSTASPFSSYAPAPRRSYEHAHWYFAAAFAVIVAGFWPTFFRPVGSGSFIKKVHGVTSSLWYIGLIAQSWLMSKGFAAMHRRVAVGMIVLLPLVAITALTTTSRMLTASIIPMLARPTIAFADFFSVTQLFALTGLGLLNRRTPGAHKRYMAATSLVGFPPVLARLYDRLGITVFGPLHTTFLTSTSS